MEDPIIKLNNLTKYYGSYKAVDELNLNLFKGEIFGLLGPNGAGKTTTILMMLGLTEPSQGTATVCGYNATSNPLAVKKKVGYMPDNVGFYPTMTALENLIYIGKLNGFDPQSAKKRAEESLHLVGLSNEANKKTSTYSRGMKQRLGLADVLMKQPEVIILDEPTLGIDPSGVKDFLTLIKQLSREQGITVLLSSHHLHHVQQVCDRVGIFVKGKLLAEGNIETLSKQLFGKNGHVTSITLSNPISQHWPLASTLKTCEHLDSIAINHQEVSFTCKQNITPQLVKILVENGCDIQAVSQKQYGLDDIYEKYFDHNTNNDNHEKSIGFLQAFRKSR